MASVSRLIRLFLVSVELGLLSAPPLASAGQPVSCPMPQLSCHDTSVTTASCCYNFPGGQFLQTQFWDTDPVTGPEDHWTIHGLWSDRCDGSYDQYCDARRKYRNIPSILSAYNKTELLNYMRTYWTSEDDESLWEHEFGKHATCMNTLNPECYSDYSPQQEVPDYFQRTVDIFKTLDTYQFLAAAGITPSSSKTYTFDEVNAALMAPRGVNATFKCRHGVLNEVWYFYVVSGSVQTGKFIAADPMGSASSCPSSGIKYLPKNTNAASPYSSATSLLGYLFDQSRLRIW